MDHSKVDKLHLNQSSHVNALWSVCADTLKASIPSLIAKHSVEYLSSQGNNFLPYKLYINPLPDPRRGISLCQSKSELVMHTMNPLTGQMLFSMILSK